MAKALEYRKQANTKGGFDTVMPRKYATVTTHRDFTVEEHWYTVSGSATVTDGLTGATYTLEAGDILICPQNSQIRTLYIQEEWVVKQLVLESAIAATDRRMNIQINWLIIQTILEILDEYHDFVSVPNETGILFKRAQTGDLYVADEYTNLVDQCIDNFVSRSGISRDVWLGENRLRTGLIYTGSYAEKLEKEYHIDDINADIGIKYSLTKEIYADIQRNPLGLSDDENFHAMKSSGLFTLRALLTVLAGSIIASKKLKIKDATGIEWMRRKLPTYKDWKDYLAEDNLPKDIIYGTRIRTIVEKILIANHASYQ